METKLNLPLKINELAKKLAGQYSYTDRDKDFANFTGHKASFYGFGGSHGATGAGHGCRRIYRFPCGAPVGGTKLSGSCDVSPR